MKISGLLIVTLAVFTKTSAWAYCTPDNETCFECGANCVAELTYTKDENNKNIGTFTVYGTGEKGAGQMVGYGTTGQEPNRTTTAPWKDKLGDINNVVITDGITNVGSYTFTGAKNISHLELPQSVDTMEYGAFMDSTLETINSLKNVTNIGGGAFYRTNLSTIDFSDELKVIGSYAFGFTNLQNVVIPDLVTSVGEYAFYGISSLQNLFVGDHVTTIGEKAFPLTAKIFCRDTIERKCEDIINDQTRGADNLVKYVQNGDGYLYKGKWYEKPSDIISGQHIKKRIYTVEEAILVSGKKNTISLRYK